MKSAISGQIAQFRLDLLVGQLLFDAALWMLYRPLEHPPIRHPNGCRRCTAGTVGAQVSFRKRPKPDNSGIMDGLVRKRVQSGGPEQEGHRGAVMDADPRVPHIGNEPVA